MSHLKPCQDPENRSAKENKPPNKTHSAKFKGNLRELAEESVNVLSGLMPQVVELRIAERKEGRRQRATAAGAGTAAHDAIAKEQVNDVGKIMDVKEASSTKNSEEGRNCSESTTDQRTKHEQTRNMDFSNKNQACESPSAKKSEPKKDHSTKSMENLHELAEESMNVLSGLMPQAIELRIAERHEARRQRAAAGATTPADTTVDTKEQVDDDAPKARTGSPSTPKLLTSSRVAPTAMDTGVWRFASNLLAGLLNFHMFWSYIVLTMFVLDPLKTILAIFALTVVATTIFALIDLVFSFVRGNDITELSQTYVDCGIERWRKFRKGEGRRFVLIAIGIILDPKSTQTSKPTPPPVRSPSRNKYCRLPQPSAQL